ncbi:hypothetical protein SBOR_7499 [Sclerotinia borealis F-4128]|uniref:Uncharacterized protein n=1 Tax=Sclerotinia borealis (strain F-4128) TaxID=1432307 RepID=W9CC19_SCLBF|nr:hypothetical protein SBOR_7499 [Sclerotinia borealis F-4128]
MATEAAARTFFSSPYFAVVGASSDPAKFGHKTLGVKSVWLQPGTYDDEILGYALREFEGGVGGEEGGSLGGEGWCVLVDGERAAGAAGRSLKL